MRKQTILTALGGALLVSSITPGQEYNSPEPNQNLEQRLSPLTQKDMFFRGVMNELLIKELVETHIDMSYPTSHYLREIQDELEFRFKGDKIKAREKLIESFSYPHRLCLALAMRYGNNEIPEQEYQDLGKKIAGLEHTMSTLTKEQYVDYLNVKVYKQIKEWGKLRTYEFQKLFLASKTTPQENLNVKQNRINYLKKVYNTAFTPEEYARHVQKEDIISNQIEKALISTITRGPIHKATIKDEIHEINESARQLRYKIYYTYFEN